MDTIGIIGAHFDDVESGACGVLMQHIAKNDNVLIFITCSDEFRTGDPVIRLNEQHNVLKKLGIPINNLKLFKKTDLMDDVIGAIDKFNIDILYVPHERDTHQDHKNASVIGMAAGRKKNISLYCYHTGSSIMFMPSMFVPIDINIKMDILKCFESQTDRGALKIMNIKNRDAYYGSMIKHEAAEGLIPIRVIKRI